MGAENRNTRKIYYQTYGAAFIRRCMKENPDAVKRINKKGDAVYELHFNTLSGYITGIEITKHEQYGDRLEIHFLDGDESFILTMSATSSHAFSFYRRMEAIDYSKKVVLMMWEYENPFMAVTQGPEGNENLLGSKYSKEDIPSWKQVEINGNIMWDKSDALNFFKPKITSVMKDIGLHGNTPKPKRNNRVERPETVEVEELGKGDLPF